MNYYAEKDYISNSDLSAFKKALALEGDRDNMQDVYNYGNLIDALITEPELVDASAKQLHLSSGGVVNFDQQQWDKAISIREAAFKHEFVMPIINPMEKQYILKLKIFRIEFEDFVFSLPVKVKLDGRHPRLPVGADLKSTACSTYKSCVGSLDTWDYDRQAAWYMDICGLSKFWFFFLCKKPNRRGLHDVFVHAVQKNDDVYNSGRYKYQKLALKYYTMVHCLNPVLVKLSTNF